MKVHLVDGTYELFRQNFGRAAKEPDAGPYAATSGVLLSTLQLLADGATHIAVASDHVIESFRNDLWAGYKTSAGMPPELLEQIPIVEEAGVIAKFGVPPASIPDYLGLVGDSADGFPGIAGWGAKSAAAVLARYGHLEDIPPSAGQWDVPGLRGAAKLSSALRADFDLALLFRRIATVQLDVEVGTVDDWRWTGPTEEFVGWAHRLDMPRLAERAASLARSRG